jgi:hypothetical protein
MEQFFAMGKLHQVKLLLVLDLILKAKLIQGFYQD